MAHQLLKKQRKMNPHELEHLCLVGEKLLVAPILGLSIALKVIDEGVHVLMMIISQLMNIKSNTFKALVKVLEGIL